MGSRAADVIDLDQMRRLTTDNTVWGLPHVRSALGLRERGSALRLWRVTCNYLYGGMTVWPPHGDGLTRRVTQADAVERPDLWWPPHVAMLPPPDFPDPARPRWYAGTTRRWAMQVGRMSVDGYPIKARPRGKARAVSETRADITQVDMDLVRQLTADDAWWTIVDVREFFGVSEPTAQHWYRACRNRWSNGVRTWPPAEGRRLATQDGPNLTWWPPHPGLLPPPESMDDKGTGRFYGEDQNRWWAGMRYLWRAGTIKAWGLKTGRLLTDGTVVTAEAA